MNPLDTTRFSKIQYILVASAERHRECIFGESHPKTLLFFAKVVKESHHELAKTQKVCRSALAIKNNAFT